MPRMGDIAAQDAYDVPLDQGTSVGWANRAAEALYARPEYDPAIVARTASPLVNITEGDIGQATSAAMGVSGGGMSTKGIKAYHSSPHDFDKFDLSKIGTGEGAQVYGHGLYFAENPQVSGQGGQYWRQFLPRFTGPEADAAQRLSFSKFDREAAMESVQRAIEGSRKRSQGDPSGFHQSAVDEYQKQLELLRSGQPVGPRTYEVNINADPAHMLDWDTKIGQQTPAVQDYFRKQIEQFGPEASMEAQYKIARSRAKGGGVELSAGMNEAGIPGIKYLDQGSRMPPADIVQAITTKSDLMSYMRDPAKRAAVQAEIDALKASIPKGTSNYVVFDPSIVDIMKKYGIAGAVPAGMGALAAQDAYQPEERM